MKVLVTGAAGFIGFHVASKLLDRGDEVVGLDNLNAYYDPKLKHARLALLEQRKGFSFARLDLNDRGVLGLELLQLDADVARQQRVLEQALRRVDRVARARKADDEPESEDHVVFEPAHVDQALEHALGFGQLEVEGHRTLVAVQVLHVRAEARPAHCFVRVDSRGRLDLDHVGAEVGELAHAGRAGPDAREIEDAEAR